MPINSISFFVFFIIFFTVYYLPFIQKTVNRQNMILLIGSLLFYAYADMEMLFLFIVFIGGFWYIGKFIGNIEDKKRKNIWTAVGCITGIGILLYFKYLNFFIESFSVLLSAIGFKNNWGTLQIALPIGISFFVFKLLAYIIDIRRGNILPEKNFVKFAAYISYFPGILSGPIDRPKSFLGQLSISRLFDYELAVQGCRQILWGLFKKMVVADNISSVISTDIHSLPGSTLFIFAIFYSIQIYADFSGYSDMAIGVGKILNLKSMNNFSMPYFSRNLAEFWKKWHISLTSWFTEYLYFALGGSRCVKWRHLTNIMIVFLVSGLWHGSNWNYVLWGGFHGLLMVLLVLMHSVRYRNIIAENRIFPSFKECGQLLSTFILATFGWILFRYENFNDLAIVFSSIFSSSIIEYPSGSVLLWFPAIFTVIMFLVEWFGRYGEDFSFMNSIRPRYIRQIVYMLLLLLILYYQGISTDFIYFKF